MANTEMSTLTIGDKVYEITDKKARDDIETINQTITEMQGDIDDTIALVGGDG